jgi:hypothetical protein
MIDLWDGSYCNLLAGVFASNCEQVDNAGKNAHTMCPPNKYWNGVQRGNHDGLDLMKMKCCQFEFHVPLYVPEDFKNFDDNTYSFKAKKHNRYLRAQDSWADFKEDGHNQLMKFTVEPVVMDLRKLFLIKNHEGKTLSCKHFDMFASRADAGLTSDTKEHFVMREWQFFAKDDGYVIYNPYNLKFLGLRDD